MAKKVSRAGFVHRQHLRWHFARYALRGVFVPNWGLVEFFNNYPRLIGSDAGSVRLFTKLRNRHGPLVRGPVLRNSPRGDVIYVLSQNAAQQVTSSDFDETFGEAKLKTERMNLWQPGALATLDDAPRRTARNWNESVMLPEGGPVTLMNHVIDTVCQEVAEPYTKKSVLCFATFKQMAGSITMSVIFGREHRESTLLDDFTPMLMQASRLLKPGESDTADAFKEELNSLLQQPGTDSLAYLCKDTSSDSGLHAQTQVRHWLFAMHDGLFVHPPRVLALILSHPDVHRWVMEELDDASLDTHSLVNKLPRLSACVRESMRLFTAVPYIVRRTKRNVVVNGFEVPDDTTIVVPAQFLHRDVDTVGPRADMFCPMATPLHVDNPDLFIFSAGPRECVGRHVAMLLIKSLVALLLKRSRLRYAGAPVHRRGRILHTLNNEALNFQHVESSTDWITHD